VPRFTIESTIAAPVEVCFDLSRSIDLHLESMITSGEKAVDGVTSGLIKAGETVSWEARHFGILWRMTSEIVAFDPPHRFVDQMVRGPFARFRHEHRFTAAAGGTTVMTDVVDFAMRLGPIANVPAGAYLRRLMRLRNEAIRAKAEGAAQ